MRLHAKRALPLRCERVCPDDQGPSKQEQKNIGRKNHCKQSPKRPWKRLRFPIVVGWLSEAGFDVLFCFLLFQSVCETVGGVDMFVGNHAEANTKFTMERMTEQCDMQAQNN
jgi:hypothetical protein